MEGVVGVGRGDKLWSMCKFILSRIIDTSKQEKYCKGGLMFDNVLALTNSRIVGRVHLAG